MWKANMNKHGSWMDPVLKFPALGLLLIDMNGALEESRGAERRVEKYFAYLMKCF